MLTLNRSTFLSFLHCKCTRWVQALLEVCLLITSPISWLQELWKWPAFYRSLLGHLTGRLLWRNKWFSMVIFSPLMHLFIYAWRVVRFSVTGLNTYPFVFYFGVQNNTSSQMLLKCFPHCTNSNTEHSKMTIFSHSLELTNPLNWNTDQFPFYLELEKHPTGRIFNKNRFNEPSEMTIADVLGALHFMVLLPQCLYDINRKLSGNKLIC